MGDKYLIFDGLNTFLRNYAANKISDPNGEPIGGVIGTIRSIKSMIREVKPSRVIFVWDGDGGSRRRRGIIAEYKSGRKPHLNREIEADADAERKNMHWQREKVKSLLGFLGVTQVEVDDIEADDTIGYLVGLLDPLPKVVVSSDRDMWQLVSDTTVVYWPVKKTYITTETFRENCPVLPQNFVLFRAMSGAGDASDNVHGIKGLGEKTILKLFPNFAKEPVTLTQLLADLDQALALDEQRAVDPPLKDTEKKWYRAILDNQELLRRNLQVMQLTSPEISAQAGHIIRTAAEAKPSFNTTGFKLALLNNNFQVTDSDMFSVFQEYRIRASGSADA